MHSILAPPSIAVAPRRAGAAVNCSAARHILAAATDVSADRIFALTQLEDIISDSLVMEVVVCELEEFLCVEADRTALWKLDTVEDLARHIVEMKARAKI
jgi:acyl carrier protein